MTAYIYTLSDPITKQIRYVGKSVNPNRRYHAHLSLSRMADSHRSRWIYGLLQNGLYPIITIVDTVEDYEDWREIERSWVRFGRMMLWPLTNETEGGDGVVPTPEIRSKMRLAKLSRPSPLKGIERPPSVRQKISDSLLGHTPWNKGRVSPNSIRQQKIQRNSARELLGLSHRQHLPDTVDKLRLASTGIIPSEETRRKLSIAGRGKKRTEETRRKISAAVKKVWQKRKAVLTEENL